MKIKSLLIGMLACTALVGCTNDDVIDNEMGKQDNSPAYLTISFSPNSNSSRSTADNVGNKGDKDGTAEESGHINDGTTAENAINNVLVVVKSVAGQDGYARLYTVATPDEGYTNEGNKDVFTATGSNDNTFYNSNEPIKLSVGTYDVLIVANPYETLYKEQQDINTGFTGNVTALYEKIINGQYEGKVLPATQNFAGDIVKVENNTLKSIMMANKSASQVELKATNTPEEPAIAQVEIERVASKITYREKKEDNIYPINVPIVSTVKAKTNVIDGTTYNYATILLEDETDEIKTTKTDVYVIVNENKALTNVYLRTNDNLGEEITNLSDTEKASVTYIYEEGSIEAESQTWYVQLKKYALVNLAKNVYNVRHIVSNGSTGVPFGTLNGSNFLWTPYWPNINNVTFDNNGNFADAGFTTNDWFNQTLAEVSAETISKDGEIPGQYFMDLKGSTMNGVDEEQDVNETPEHEGYNENPDIGTLLAYCLENSTDIEHQTHGLSTGITFMAMMYKDAACTEPIEKLYRYAGHLFESIAAIQKAYGITADADAAGLAGLTESSTADELAAAQVAKYAGNTCYYYTTEIKHFDNGNPTVLENMEFAIMRNNIYSLAVTNVNVIGDPYVDPTPSTPNELKETALVVEAEIMPWIVRYHDIEFK